MTNSFVAQFYNFVAAGQDQIDWSYTSANNPVLSFEQTYTIQGVNFLTGTVIQYCNPTTVPLSGFQLRRGGAVVTIGTVVDLSN